MVVTGTMDLGMVVCIDLLKVEEAIMALVMVVVFLVEMVALTMGKMCWILLLLLYFVKSALS